MASVHWVNATNALSVASARNPQGWYAARIVSAPVFFRSSMAEAKSSVETEIFSLVLRIGFGDEPSFRLPSDSKENTVYA